MEVNNYTEIIMKLIDTRNKFHISKHPCTILLII